MGRIKTQLIKRITKQLMDKKGADLSTDFATNQKSVSEFLDVPSKKLRNIIAGYTTRLVKKQKKE